MTSYGHFYFLPRDSGGVLWFNVERLCVCQSIRPSVIRLSIHF